MKNQDLNAAIELLKKEHELSQLAADKLGEIKHFSRCDKNKYIWCELTENKQFAYCLNQFEPTNEFIEVGNDNLKVDSSFRIDIENPAMYARTVKISWQSNDIHFSVRIPENWLNDFLVRTDRKIYESEYHYFTGVSMKELLNRKLTKMNFKSNQINWYGGSVTLVDSEEISAIIEFLTNNQ